MFDRNSKTLMRALALAASWAGGGVAGETASAQEVILLETIGAVRMAPPEEVRRTAAEQASARLRAQDRPRREEQEASAR
ncbi:hypothetical protein [Methylobacterium sp. J-090]|uniref:hypothetical protein n=1 Tax=Methylobacterium sp. J-090 TaxID=2836666 RepID=UPI001FBA9C31|nr:hypothetical protein [Methylobacterium sp. J-090]MCJ2082014.1 hypothetical protein [Methylobacterium sp. J-090]